MIPRADVLNPSIYASTRLPVIEAETLPACAYTSEDSDEREIERIFRRQWNLVGHGARIPMPARLGGEN